MSEEDFYFLVDCNFPYHDRAEAARLIELACSISSNAAFTIAYELARVPARKEVGPQALLDLLARLDACLDHPLKPRVLSVARRMIAGDSLSLPEVLAAMREVATYPDEYQALNVVYFSGMEAWDEVEAVYEEIVGRWRNRGSE